MCRRLPGALLVWGQAQLVLTSFTTWSGVRIKDTCVFTRLCTHTGVWVVRMIAFVYICLNRHTYVGTQGHVFTHAFMSARMGVCTHKYVACIYVHTHACAHLCICVRVQMFVLIARHQQVAALLLLLGQSRSAGVGVVCVESGGVSVA